MARAAGDFGRLLLLLPPPPPWHVAQPQLALLTCGRREWRWLLRCARFTLVLKLLLLVAVVVVVLLGLTLSILPLLPSLSLMVVAISVPLLVASPSLSSSLIPTAGVSWLLEMDRYGAEVSRLCSFFLGRAKRKRGRERERES